MKIKKFSLKLLISVLLFCMVISIGYVGIEEANEKYRVEKMESVKRAVLRATVSCYAIEGVYPPDIEYLKEHYGLMIDDDYIVYYDIFASNIMPDIDILPASYQ